MKGHIVLPLNDRKIEISNYLKVTEEELKNLPPEKRAFNATSIINRYFLNFIERIFLYNAPRG